MKKNIHIISHTHWDREWYLSSKYVNKWLPIFFENLFQMLEKEPEYRFVLDGQTAIIEDCCIELQKDSEEKILNFKDKLRKFVQMGRIIIGPYYLQPDWQLISGEALIRNMLYGKCISEEFGRRSNTGWLLDNFGQISQTVQIHEQFGIKGAVVWRGVGLPPENIKSEFLWEAPDGTRLPCVYLLSSYRNGMRLAVYPEYITGRIVSEAEKIKDFAQTDHLLLMNGYDQEMEPDDILPYIRNGNIEQEKYQICQSIPDEYMEKIIEGIRGKEIPVLEGALYSGRYISVFPGILSSRIYLKQKNDELQRKIEGILEPLGSMGLFMGDQYFIEQVDKIWKKLLKNHPHDSICGVSVDDVHSDMEARFEEVAKESGHILKAIAQKMVSRINTDCFKKAEAVFVVFNTTMKEKRCQILFPIEKKAIFEVQDETGKKYEWQRTERGVIAEVILPPYGFRTFGVYVKSENVQKNVAEKQEDRTYPVMENRYLRVEFQKNGTFTMVNKQNGKIYKNLGYLEDCADGGDEYNYSNIAGDRTLTTLEEDAKVSLIEKGDLRSIVKVEYNWKLPLCLSDDRTKRSEEKETVPITTYVMLQKDSKILRFHTIIKNRCMDHRIRVLFPTGIYTKYSYAQTQFDITRHEIEPEIFDDSNLSDNIKRIVVGARESGGITQFPQKDFVAITDGEQGVSVLNRGLPEYEVLSEETTIALTLFRSVGWLARTDLNTRIGDAGPEIFTPDAQCLRDMEFYYGVCLFEGTVEDGRLEECAEEMNHPAFVIQTTSHTGDLSSEKSFCRLESEADIQVTAIKNAQDQKGIIFRLYHTGRKIESAKLVFDQPIEKIYKANLAEEKEEELMLQDKTTEIQLLPFRIITLYVVPKGYTKNQLKQSEFHSDELVNIVDQTKEQCVEIFQSVTEKDVEREKERAERAEAEFGEQQNIYDEAMKKKEEHSDYQRAVLKLNAEVKHRTALEARLSYIYTMKKYKEQEGEEMKEFFVKIDQEIQRLADQLNIVRVERRAAEYWVDYFQQSEKDKIENR